MIFVFALWAVEGYSYPSSIVTFVLNAVSKVLAFACAAMMFMTMPKEVTSGVNLQDEGGSQNMRTERNAKSADTGSNKN